jgi:succinoglycan biosynthesis protein ExoU
MRLTGAPERSVDVLIAAWNRSDTIADAISSALEQPEVRAVIVVDDASTDDTAARAERVGAGSGRVIVQRLSSNSGPSAARNYGLELSNTPWVAVLDGDDFLLPGRIGKILAHADGWDFVADDILRTVMFDAHFEPWRLDFATFVAGNCSRRGRDRRELGYFKPLMRRAFLDRSRLRYNERLRLGEDYVLYAQALALGARFLVMPASGYVSVARADSLSARHSKEDLERLRDADQEFGRISGLSRRDRRALRRHYRSVDGRVRWLSVIEGFKARSVRRFITPFCGSPPVSLFLFGQLLEEIFGRSRQYFRR